MASNSHIVAVIAEHDAAARVRDVSARLPVWVVDTPTNRLAAAELREDAARAGSHGDVTLFRADPEGLPDDWVVGILSTIVEHHGDYAHVPPLAALELYGVLVTDPLRAALSKHGFDLVTSDGDVVLAQVAPTA
jgi:hypothetical protein